MTIETLSQYAGWIMAIATCFAFFYKPARQWLHNKLIHPDEQQDKQIEVLNDRIGDVESWQRKQQHDIDVSAVERYILMRSMRSCLEAVSGKRNNGNVDESIEEINEFLAEQAHKTKSRMEA